METEIWKDVVGYEGEYQVSNVGRVRSIKKGKCLILKQFKTLSGYNKCTFWLYGKSNNLMVHRLVCSAFIGEPNGMQVNHIDENKLNNNIKNLEYVSGRENIQKYYSTRVNKNKLLGASYYKPKNKWRSFIRVNGKQIFLGYFNTELEANKAYVEASKKYDNGTNN